jgi:hypothetical protein
LLQAMVSNKITAETYNEVEYLNDLISLHQTI